MTHPAFPTLPSIRTAAPSARFGRRSSASKPIGQPGHCTNHVLSMCSGPAGRNQQRPDEAGRDRTTKPEPFRGLTGQLRAVIDVSRRPPGRFESCRARWLDCTLRGDPRLFPSSGLGHVLCMCCPWLRPLPTAIETLCSLDPRSRLRPTLNRRASSSDRVPQSRAAAAVLESRLDPLKLRADSNPFFH